MNFECGSDVLVGAARLCPPKPAKAAPAVAPGALDAQPAPGAAIVAPPPPAVVLAAAFTLQPNEVALALFDGGIGLHIGFVFCHSGTNYKFLHLAFHNKLTIEDCPLAKCSIIGKLPFRPETVKYVRNSLTRIGRNMPSIPYGVRIDKAKGSFDNQGRYRLPKGSDGLTCATFVVEVCRGVGLPLLVQTDWQPRPVEDAGWLDAICRMLEHPDSTATPEHVQRVRDGFDGLRIRPEDVASVVPQWRRDGKPLAFDVVDAERKLVASFAQRCCSEEPLVEGDPLVDAALANDAPPASNAVEAAPAP